MALEALSAPLKRVELFQGLQPGQIDAIARHAERIVFRPGEVIVQQNAAGDAAFVVVTGEARRIAGPGAGDDQETIGPASLIGEMAMIVETEHSATVAAATQVRALKITRESLHEMMNSDPDIAGHFVDVIVGRLRRVASELERVDQGLAQSLEGASQSDVASDGEAGDEAEPAAAATTH